MTDDDISISKNIYTEWKKWTPEEFGTFQSDSAYFLAETKKYLTSNKLKILEIGFGNGNFIGWIKDRCFEIHGVETNEVLCERASFWLNSYHLSIFAPALAVHNETFDMVVAFDVLEHIPKTEIIEFMRKVRSLLKPGGVFFARFPNGDSPFGRIFQHGDLTHVNTIGKLMAIQIAKGADFELAEYRSPKPILFAENQNRVNRMIILVCRKILQKFISFLYFNNEIVSLEPNSIAVWQRKN